MVCVRNVIAWALIFEHFVPSWWHSLKGCVTFGRWNIAVRSRSQGQASRVYTFSLLTVFSFSASCVWVDTWSASFLFVLPTASLIIKDISSGTVSQNKSFPLYVAFGHVIYYSNRKAKRTRGNGCDFIMVIATIWKTTVDYYYGSFSVFPNSCPSFR